MKLTNVSVTINEPVSLDEIKEHLRIDSDEEDFYLLNLIKAARSMAEDYCNVIFAQQTFVLVLDKFSDPISLPKVPVVSITSIQYIDTDGATQPLTDYHLSGNHVEAKLVPAYNESWPDTEAGFEKVTITYVAGYATIPELVKHAVKLISGSLYNNREDHAAINLAEIPYSSRVLLNGFRRVVV